MKKNREKARQAVRKCREKKQLQLQQAKEDIITLRQTLNDLNSAEDTLDREYREIVQLYKLLSETSCPEGHFDLGNLTQYEYAE